MSEDRLLRGHGEAAGDLVKAEHEWPGALFRTLLLAGGAALVLVLLTACGTTLQSPFVVETVAVEKPIFHPPLPPPVYPYYPDPIVVTPELARQWDEEIKAGEREPYVVIGFDPQTWLSLGIYWGSVDAYLRHLREVVKYYGHPKLQDPEPAPSSADSVSPP